MLRNLGKSFGRICETILSSTRKIYAEISSGSWTRSYCTLWGPVLSGG